MSDKLLSCGCDVIQTHYFIRQLSLFTSQRLALNSIIITCKEQSIIRVTRVCKAKGNFTSAFFKRGDKITWPKYIGPKCAKPDSQQIGIAAYAVLPAVMRQDLTED